MDKDFYNEEKIVYSRIKIRDILALNVLGLCVMYWIIT